MASQKIIVVEDEPAISDTIVYALNSDGFQVTVCTTRSEALEAMKSSEFALGIFDIGLPDGTGFELLREIRSNSSLPVIFLTARSAEVDRVSGLEMGADDYVVKPFSPRELAARVRTVLRRVNEHSVPAQPSPGTRSHAASKSAAFSVDETKFLITYRGQPLPLSRYEYRLLCVLLRAPGRVFSREQLMQLAWEEPEMSLERTVDAHIKTIRAKLRKIDPETDPVVTHRGFGYSLRENLE